MRALFKTRVELVGVDYACGTHEVPQAHAAGWYFDALVKDGLIVLSEDQPARIEEAVQVEAASSEELAEISPMSDTKRRGRPPKTQAE